MPNGNLPGFGISVLRQRTFGRPNEPIIISGRVSALGLGLLALVRVFLEGPELNPEVRTFDTLAAPVTGDYSVAVLAERGGRYEVFSRAFLPIALPVPGGVPLLLGPPLAESLRPPLIIGQPVNGRVEFEAAPGRPERVAPPPATAPEVFAPITTIVQVPGAPRGPAPAPAPPGPPEAPARVLQVGG